MNWQWQEAVQHIHTHDNKIGLGISRSTDGIAQGSRASLDKTYYKATLFDGGTSTTLYGRKFSVSGI